MFNHVAEMAKMDDDAVVEYFADVLTGADQRRIKKMTLADAANFIRDHYTKTQAAFARLTNETI